MVPNLSVILPYRPFVTMGDTSLATSRLSLFRLALLLGSIVLAICLYHSETSYRYIAGVSRVHRIISAGNGTDDTTTNLRPATTLDPRNGSNSDRGYKTLWKDKYNMTEWTLENQGGAAFSRYPHFYGPTQNINKFSLRMHMCRGPEYPSTTRLRLVCVLTLMIPPGTDPIGDVCTAEWGYRTTRAFWCLVIVIPDRLPLPGWHSKCLTVWSR